MLFLPHRPTHTIIEQHNKLILTTPSQIIFACLDFLQEYITTHLVSTYPISVAYSPQKSEALVITKDYVMIYWTDWQHRVELHLALYLNNEKVYSFDWEQKWIVYGEFRQYGTKKLALYNTRNYDEDLPSCFLGRSQFLLTNKKIVVYDHKLGTRKNVEWHDSRQWLPKLTENIVELAARRTYEGNNLLKINNLCVIIKQAKVMNQKSNNGTLSISKQMAVWFANNRMKIYQIDEYQFIDLGEIQTYDGYYYTSTVYNNRLCLFFYDFKELQMKNLKLVSTEEYKEQAKKRQQRQLMKRSMREDRSVSEKAVSEHSKPLSKGKKQDFVSQESKSVKFKAGSMQQALKASINSFKQEVERSLKKQKFVDNPPPPEQKYLKINYDKFKMLPEIKKKLGFDFPNRPEPQPQKPTELKKSGRGKEPSEYEQQLQSPDRVNQLNSHILSTLSSFEVEKVHSPVHSNGNTRTGDSWAAFHNLSNCNQRKQQRDPPKPPNKSGKSILRKMSKIHRQHPQEFDQALDSMVSQIIHQNDAKLFFTEYVRLFNSESTKDRVLKLYRHIQDTPQNKKLMAIALGQFKLNQVPEICLPIEEEVLKVFHILHPSIHIEDLLEPTPQVYQQLIQSYFAGKNTQQIIKIQDESIDLTHPRNLLNVLLYLNEYFRLQLDMLFEVYAKGMMRHQCCHILKKITESNIFDICQVESTIFQKAAVSVAIQILEQCTANLDIVRPIINLMEKKSCEMFQQILTMIHYCNSCNIAFPISPLFELPQTKEGFKYMRDLISENSAANLINLNVSLLFKFISKIESDTYANYYTSNHVTIMKQLCQKLMQSGFHEQAFEVIMPVSHIIKRGFIAALLFKYFQGKHANRFAGVKVTEPAQIQTILQQLIIQKNYIVKRDAIPVQVNQHKKLIPWAIFRNVTASYLPKFSWELSYILYSDIMLSNQLVQQSIITSEQFYFLQKKIGHSTLQIRRLTLIESKEEHLNTPFFIGQSRSSSSNEINPFFLNVNNNQNTLTAQRSLKNFDKKQQQSNNRRRSGGILSQKQPDSALVSLRLEVYQAKILTMLQEYYKQSPKVQFLKAIKVVDKQRVQLHNIDNYKYLIQANIVYPFQKLIPFSYFVNQTQAWEITENILRKQLTIDNFWILYLIINILYHRGTNVAKMLIQKIIAEDDDSWSSAIQLILSNICIEAQFLKKVISIAQKRGLNETKSIIKNFIKEI